MPKTDRLVAKVIWYPDARQERQLATAYCFEHFGKRAAAQLQNELDQNSILLRKFPNMGSIEWRLDYLPVTVRYLVVDGLYKEYYYVKNDEVRILRLWHCAQESEKLYTYFENNPHILNEPRVAYQPQKKPITPE